MWLRVRPIGGAASNSGPTMESYLRGLKELSIDIRRVMSEGVVPGVKNIMELR